MGSNTELDFEESKVIAEVVAAFLRLRRRNLASQLSQMQFQLMAAQEQSTEEADEESDVDLNQLTQEVQRLSLQIRRLDRPPALQSTTAALGNGN